MEEPKAPSKALSAEGEVWRGRSRPPRVGSGPMLLEIVEILHSHLYILVLFGVVGFLRGRWTKYESYFRLRDIIVTTFVVC